jgi:hypothetical protein
VSRLLAVLGSFVGGSLGWWVGARLGTMTAYLLSVVGTGLGLYLGHRLATRLLE